MSCLVAPNNCAFNIVVLGKLQFFLCIKKRTPNLFFKNRAAECLNTTAKQQNLQRYAATAKQVLCIVNTPKYSVLIKLWYLTPTCKITVVFDTLVYIILCYQTQNLSTTWLTRNCWTRAKITTIVTKDHTFQRTKLHRKWQLWVIKAGWFFFL